MNRTSKFAFAYSVLLLIVITWYSSSTLAYSSHVQYYGLTQASPVEEEYVTILDVFQSGSHISIVLSYNFSTTAQLETSECLAVFVVFVNQNSNEAEAAMLFFHTVDDQFLCFWMIGDPYHQSQHWQQSEQFQVNHNILDLDFTEFLEITNPYIDPVILAKILSDFNVNEQTRDFQGVLEVFGLDLLVDYWYHTITTTTTESSTPTPGFIPGFTLLIAVGALVPVSLILRNKRKQ